MLPINGLSLIGRSESLPNDQFFYAVNPTTNQALPTAFYQATSEEVEHAIALAELAFHNEIFNSVTVRVALLQLISQNIQKHSEQLLHWYCLETGLPNKRAKGELTRACFQFDSYAQSLESGYVLQAVIDDGDANRKPSPKPAIRKVNIPLGPIAVFSASNFPFAYGAIGGDVASGLAAGCPVIVKGHGMHPHTSELAARIINLSLEKLKLPKGVFAHLVASNFEVGEQLVAHPTIKAVGFTGSVKGGKALLAIANNRVEPIPVYAEMGSVNPIVISKETMKNRLHEIAQQIAQSIALNAGQFCTSPGIIFIQDSVDSQEFIKQLTTHFSICTPQYMLHPTIFNNYTTELKARVADADKSVLGFAKDNAITPSLAVVSGERFIQNNHLQDEVFGSFCLVVLYKNEHELIACLQQLVGQLTISLFVEDNETNEELLTACTTKTGRLIFNGVPTGVEVTTAMQHGGPFPSSSKPQSTAVGADAVKRFMRPVAFQNCPENMLPLALKKQNPLAIYRFVNGEWQK